MKKSNGEIVTATVIAIAVATFLVGACWKPLTTVLGLGNQQQKITQKNTIIRESKPYYITGDDGRAHLIEATKTTTTDIDTNEEQKLSIWQKLMNVGRIWVVLMILGCFFPPLAIIMQAFNQKTKDLAKATYDKLLSTHEELKSETTTIVQSVDQALKTFDAAITAAQSAANVAADEQTKKTQQAIILALTETKNNFLLTLSKKQDSSTKTLVSTLKNNA